MLRHRLINFAFATGLLFAALVPSYAQTIAASINGTVTDSSGAIVPGAPVTVTNTLTGEKYATTTNNNGDYRFPSLTIGEYRVDVQAKGFKRYVRSGLTLTVNQNATVNIALEVGELSQEIEIKGDAPLVDTSQSQLGGLVDSQRVTDLPLNGRNVYGLVSLLPGVTSMKLNSVPDQTQGTQVNVNGSRTLQTTFLLDGGLNNSVWRNGGNQSPNPDTVEEFRLITSNYSAEYGRSAGGVVSVVTKSGTNQFHGTLFEFLRNNKLDARNFFQADVTKLIRNQFGGSVGGPILHDRLFFFFSYEGDRVRSSQFVNNARTPTAAQRGGDFSTVAAAQRPKDPDSGVLFPGGIIPTTRLDPVALNLLKYVPLPTTPDGRVEATRGTSEGADQFFLKSDYHVNPAHRLTGELFIDRGNQIYPFTNAGGTFNLPDYAPVAFTGHQNNLQGKDTWTIRPTLLNEFMFSWATVYDPLEYQKRFSWADLGSQLKLGAEPARPPSINVTGGWNVGGSGDFIRYDQNFDWSDTLTLIRNNHVMKMGGLVIYQRSNEVGDWLGSGQAAITGAFTGNAFADFEMGRAATFRVNNGTDRHYSSKNWSLFFQDDWKVNRRLTVNLGLRYEVLAPFISNTDQFQTFQYNQQSRIFPTAPLGLLYPGDPGISRGIVPGDYNNWAPRVGIALDPFGNGKTAIRAGYGIFYSAGFAGLAYSNLGQPYLVDASVFGTTSFVQPFATFPGGSPFPVAPDFKNPRFFTPVTATWMDQDWATPYVQQYNFTVQQQLMKDLALEVAYVGNTSHKLNQQVDANQPIFTAGKSTAANVDARRPYLPGVFSFIGHASTAANANYNALQASLNRRFSHGFSILANYSYSKAIDYQSQDQQSNTSVDFVDSNHIAVDRGVSALDLRHVVNISFLWQLPDVQRYGSAARLILSGWQLNGIGRYASGQPFSVTSGADTNLNGVNNDRPNLLRDPHMDTGRSRQELLTRYFDPTAFQAAAAGTLGSAGRDILYGPGSKSWNMSLFRQFRIREHQHLDFRAEFFNVFNQVSFGNPVSVLSNANVGRILAAGSPRISQFGLKYIF